MNAVAHKLAHGWHRFWFAPQPTSTLAIYRIVFGLLVFAWTAAFLPYIQAFFGPHAVQADPGFQAATGWWGVLNSIDTGWAATTVVVALLVASACLCVGFLTRLASIVVFVGVLSLEHRTSALFNAGDGVIRISAFFLMFAPAGASLSLDRWLLHRDRFWEFPARAPWALRLIQVQLSIVYLCSVYEKLLGAAWRHGTAVGLSLGLQDMWRFHPPGVMIHSLLFSAVLTYLTLAIELVVGILVWNRAARPLVLAFGAMLHLGIDLSLNVTFFSEAMLTTYLVFLSPAAAAAFALAVRRRVAQAPVVQAPGETLAPALASRRHS